VIVIMGILAAVAVPKLFGMIAKSKASEVGPAAGTYVKLQDAFAAESGAAGTWAKIGYIGPGTKGTGDNANSSTTVFNYKDNFGTGDATTLVGELPESSSPHAAWEAKAKTALNDCAVESAWTVKIAKGSTTADGSLIKYVAANPSGTGCASLTANFEKIGN